jgi:hypothetical protein
LAPPFPVSQPTFKFKRFSVQFHKKIALAALSFFLLRIFFSWTKSFIDIDYEPVTQLPTWGKICSKKGKNFYGKSSS